MNLPFSRQIFEKYSNVKFHENPFIGNRGVPCGQTDRQDEANIRFSQFCERAWKLSFIIQINMEKRKFYRKGMMRNLRIRKKFYKILRGHHALKTKWNPLNRDSFLENVLKKLLHVFIFVFITDGNNNNINNNEKCYNFKHCVCLPFMKWTRNNKVIFLLQCCWMVPAKVSKYLTSQQGGIFNIIRHLKDVKSLRLWIKLREGRPQYCHNTVLFFSETVEHFMLEMK